MKKLLICLLAISLISLIALSGCKNDNDNVNDNDNDSSSISDNDVLSSSKTESSSAAVSSSKTNSESETKSENADTSDKNTDSSTNDKKTTVNQTTASETKKSSADDNVVDYKASDLVTKSTIKDDVFTYENISFEVPKGFEIDRLSKSVNCKNHDDCKSRITFYDSTQSMIIEKRMQYDKISEDFVKEMFSDSIKKAQSHGMETGNDNGGVRSFEKYEINGCKAVKYTIELKLGNSDSIITSVLVYVNDKLYSIGFTDYDGKHLNDFNKCIDTISVK